MMSDVDRLLAVIPAPYVRPMDEGAWRETERALGSRLPTDFKALVDAYGPGSFDGFLWLLQPSSVTPYLNVVEQNAVRLDALREVRDGGVEVPFVVDSTGAELMPWAITDNGDVCYWIRRPLHEPDQWTVVVNESRGPTWVRFDGPTAEFLFAVLSGQTRVEVFPDDFPSAAPSFEALPD